MKIRNVSNQSVHTFVNPIILAATGSQRLFARDAILSRDSLRLNSCLATLMGPLSQRCNEFCK
jgi:hypothetical protein